MCFSATASFVTSAVTIAAGVTALIRAGRREELPLAATPIVFGTQQAIEGLLWLRVDAAHVKAVSGWKLPEEFATLRRLLECQTSSGNCPLCVMQNCPSLGFLVAAHGRSTPAARSRARRRWPSGSEGATVSLVQVSPMSAELVDSASLASVRETCTIREVVAGQFDCL